MDESALERFFDNFIANDSLKIKEEEEEEQEEQEEEEEEEEQEEEVKGEQGDELFFSLLPDELLTLYEDVTDSSTRRDYSSQNSTAAAKLPGGSSKPEPSAAPGHPAAPLMSLTQRPEIVPQIHNVISSVMLGCRLDLHFIACKAWNVEYKPKIFNTVTMRIREPRATVQIYTSGKMVCVGTRGVQQSRLAARKCARIVQKLGFPVSFRNFKIWNLVASCSIFPLNVRQLAQHQNCSYEPELFPGLHWRVMPGVTATIFQTGRIFFTGAKTEAEIYKAFDTIYPTLSCFRRR